ncbi:MAG TPA: GtrA family protein [Acidimicrobiales bacterium]|nr:GtrA family protein [Acidimicrobiales bacterium]
MDIKPPSPPHNRLDRLWQWSHSHEGRKLIRYTSVSAITTIVSFVTIAFVYGVGLTSSEVAATMIGNLVAAAPAYFLHRTWVWGKRGRSHLLREVVPFWTMVVLGIGVSTLGAMGVRHLVNQHQWSHLVDTALVSSANVVSFGVFWILKIALFNRIFRVDPLAGIDAHLSDEERSLEDQTP